MEFESNDAMRKKVDSFTYKPQISSFGHVLKVGDGIFWADGLEGLQLSELVELPGEIYGMALSLSENYNGIALLNGEYDVTEGMEVVENIEIAKTNRADRPVENIRILKASIQ